MVESSAIRTLRRSVNDPQTELMRPNPSRPGSAGQERSPSRLCSVAASSKKSRAGGRTRVVRMPESEGL